MSLTKKPLFSGAVANAATQYVVVPVRRGTIGCHIAWTDATSSATITLELSSFPPEEAANDAAAGYVWEDSGETITGPNATAAGSTVLNIENVRQSRARLKIVAAANSNFIIYNGDQP